MGVHICIDTSGPVIKLVLGIEVEQYKAKLEFYKNEHNKLIIDADFNRAKCIRAN